MIRPSARGGLVASIALLLLVVAACGGGAAPGAGESEDGGEPAADPGDGDDGGSGAGIDLCAVLTLDEVSAAAGVEATDAQGVTAGDVSSCNWMSADGQAVAGNTYTRGGDAIDPAQMLDANFGEGAEEISDLGDRAILTGDENFPIVMVLKGGALYSISVLAADTEDKQQATIDLARISVDRLP